MTKVGVHLSGVENPAAFKLVDPYTGEEMLWVTEWIRVRPVRRRKIFGGPHADELHAKLAMCLANHHTSDSSAVSTSRSRK